MDLTRGLKLPSTRAELEPTFGLEPAIGDDGKPDAVKANSQVTFRRPPKGHLRSLHERLGRQAASDSY